MSILGTAQDSAQYQQSLAFAKEVQEFNEQQTEFNQKFATTSLLGNWYRENNAVETLIKSMEEAGLNTQMIGGTTQGQSTSTPNGPSVLGGAKAPDGRGGSGGGLLEGVQNIQNIMNNQVQHKILQEDASLAASDAAIRNIEAETAKNIGMDPKNAGMITKELNTWATAMQNVFGFGKNDNTNNYRKGGK